MSDRRAQKKHEQSTGQQSDHPDYPTRAKPHCSVYQAAAPSHRSSGSRFKRRNAAVSLKQVAPCAIPSRGRASIHVPWQTRSLALTAAGPQQATVESRLLPSKSLDRLFPLPHLMPFSSTCSVIDIGHLANWRSLLRMHLTVNINKLLWISQMLKFKVYIAHIFLHKMG